MSFLKKLGSKHSLKLDLTANLAGMGWGTLVQFVCIPFYIKFLGVEGYGLIGFCAMMQILVQMLDLGITPTINREMARYSVRPELAAEARDLVRTIEVGYAALGGVIALMIISVAPLVANHWIHAVGISGFQVREAVMAMGLLLFFQWLVTFHQAGLIGLHQQVFVNVVKIVATGLSSGGALLVLWLVSANATSLFLWQAAIAALQAVVLMAWLWHSMPPADTKPRLNFGLLRGIWRFAAGMSGITVSAIVLTQLDKLILSRICSLKVFGYYVLAAMFGRALLLLGTPVFDAIFPRFSALLAAKDERSLIHLYHRCSQVMAVLIVPVSAVLAMFSGDILLSWTRNPDIARNSAAIASVLSVAAAINALMVLPYTLQLAYGWTSIGLKMNLTFMVMLVPVIWVFTIHYGGMGAASAYLAFMCMYMATGVPLTHRRVLKGSAGTWFLRDVGLPVLAVLPVVGLARLLYSQPVAQITAVIALGLIFLVSLSAAAFAAPSVREWLVAAVSKARPAYV